MSAKDKRPIVLFGYPLRHSLSPLIHNTAFEHQGLDYHYSLHPVSPTNLAEDLRRLVDDGLAGANVTVPHKQAVVKLLDETSKVVATIGAANTISCRHDDGRVTLIGDNSDVGGFIAPIRQMLHELEDQQVMIFGSGGAAKAVGYAVCKYASSRRLVVASRSPDSGQNLVRMLAGLQPGFDVEYVRLDGASEAVRESTLLVNATPLGMGSKVDESVWTDSGDFHEGQIVYDLIYWPLETRLMKAAKARGARTIGGLEMLIQQAALSYAIWTGQQMPVDVVREELRRYLAAADHGQNTPNTRA